MIKVFIGYDKREIVAYHVCSNSIIRQSSNPLSISPLALNLLKDYKEVHTDGSNHFIYSRFLVPYLMNFEGWAIFIDGDMILRDDITQLWNLKQPNLAVQVVKHNYKTKLPIKYLGAKNEDYPCKNWSSVIIWNCAHPKNKILTPAFIEASTGAQLHRFTWLNEEEIGELPIEWNWLPDEFGCNDAAKLLHFTLGLPGFYEFTGSPMAHEWHAEKILTNYCEQPKLK
jgi:lipopolysaccharide biosynthesis glycosyltransferase